MKRLLILLFCLESLVAAGAADQPAAAAGRIEILQKKSRIKVLVTDSGLGGLSVCGDLERKALARKAFESVEIIFCNALPEVNCGYNDFKTAQRKAEVFSDALNGMVARHDPDAVLIACNTLSVVYPDTRISRTLKVPVMGIIDLGVSMICESLKEDATAFAVIFGSDTTVAANTHRSRCVAQGIAASRIVVQPCGELASEIQSSPQGEATKNLIDLYAGEAASQLPERAGKIVAALCCTHYGYCADLFVQAFAAAGRKDVEILNPNEHMADLLLAPTSHHRFQTSSVMVKVVSRAFLSPDEIRSISSLLEMGSPRTAEALRRYEHKADLFPFRRE